MTKEIIFIGGGDYRKDENKEIDSYIFSKIPENSNITIVPFATKDADKRQSIYNSLVKVFSNYSQYNFFMLDENSQSKEEMSQLILDSNIVFLSGGDPLLLIEEIEKFDLINPIKNFNGILVGYSAGAMILSNKIIIPGGMDKRFDENQVVEKGLGFVNYSVVPHYSDSFYDKIKDLSNEDELYAIENMSALITNFDKKNELGKVHKF